MLNPAHVLTLALDNSSQTAWERPRCIFTPPDAEGVSLAVRTAAESESQFAVRSGGHSPFPRFASIGNGGFLISLSGIKDLHYDAETETQRSGFGNLWGDVYGYLAQFNRIIVGGRSSSVGLALTLGDKGKKAALNQCRFISANDHVINQVVSLMLQTSMDGPARILSHTSSCWRTVPLLRLVPMNERIYSLHSRQGKITSVRPFYEPFDYVWP